MIDARLVCGHVESDGCNCYCPRCEERLSPDPEMGALCDHCTEIRIEELQSAIDDLEHAETYSPLGGHDLRWLASMKRELKELTE